MNKVLVAAALAATLASCTTTTITPPNPNQPNIVEGYSCKQKIWSPNATPEAAELDMRRNAAVRGYSDVRDVTVAADPLAVARNCWVGYLARGTGVR